MSSGVMLRVTVDLWVDKPDDWDELDAMAREQWAGEEAHQLPSDGYPGAEVVGVQIEDAP